MPPPPDRAPELSPPRRATRVVAVGRVLLGGDEPVRVQTMTTGKTRELDAALAEMRPLVDAGAEMIRVAVPTARDAAQLAALRRALPVPVIADIHFNPRLALAALDQGADKVRLNPGNINEPGVVEAIVRRAAALGRPLRLGVNAGSLEPDLLARHGWPAPEALAESALRWVERAEGWGLRALVASIKSSDVRVTLAANRRFAAACDVPLHLGITEAGPPGYGTLKSAVGIGALLLEGIGDTIRVSLTGDSRLEVQAAWDILKATGRRVREPEIIACPGCGRLALDLERAVGELRARLAGSRRPIRVAVLGCIVNGPGEAAEADFALAGGTGAAVVYRQGRPIRRVAEAEMIDALLEEIERHGPEP